MVTFRWLRWTAAIGLLIGAWIATAVLASRFGPRDGSTWPSELAADLRALANGSVTPDLVLRWTTLVMATALVWISAHLIALPMIQWRGKSGHLLSHRWVTAFVCSGVAIAGIDTTSVSAAPSTSDVVSAIEVADSDDLSFREENEVALLTATSIVSGLIGAGVASRVKLRDRQERRVDRVPASDSIPDPKSLVVDEDMQKFIGAETTLADITEILRRISESIVDNEVRHVIDERNGWYVIEFSRPVKVIPNSELVTSRSLRMVADRRGVSHETTSTADLPAMIHVGRSMAGDVWVSLDAYGEFGVDCSDAEGERVWRHLSEGLCLAPHLDARAVISDVELSALSPRRIFKCGDGSSLDDDVERIEGSIAVLHDRVDSVSVPTLRRVTDGPIRSGLSRSRGEWRLCPSDIPIQPVGTGGDDIRRIRELLGEVTSPIVVRTRETVTSSMRTAIDWNFMACVLGPPIVVDSQFEPVDFERGKAEELVIWLAFHPQQRKRSLARTALWLTPVQDATFSNITAAARRSLNAVHVPPIDRPWVGITMSDDLPLAEGFVTDVDQLRSAVDWARRNPEDGGLERLRECLQLVRGVPFAGSTYTWSDGIGMSGEAATLVVRAATMMAEMCQELGDMGGVYWATSKGLLALPGHEELVAVRLRAHAEHGDRIAMRAEWESYRRVLATEWGDPQPSERMMDLWRNLGVD